MAFRIIERIAAAPWAYRLLSSLVNDQKVASILKIQGDFSGLKVLDIGCGPGTNAPLFARARYTGVEINPRYLAEARRRFPGLTFLPGDAVSVEWGEGHDAILFNSFLHHVPDDAVSRLLKKAAAALRPGGLVIVQEPLVPPDGELYPRLLRRLDRGRHFRSFAHWRSLSEAAGFAVARCDFYDLRILGPVGMHMVSLGLRR